MIFQFKTTIVLHSINDANVIEQYDQDNGWNKVAESKNIIAYECNRKKLISDSIYIPSRKIRKTDDIE